MEQMHPSSGAQLPLLDLPRPHRAPPQHRVFLAVYPDDVAQLKIGAEAWRLHNQHGLRGRPLEIGQFHLPLFGLGEHHALPERSIAAARRAAATVAARSFELCLDRAQSLARADWRQPLVMAGEEGLAGFSALQESLGQALRRVGLEPRAGLPRLTLLHDRRRLEEVPVKPVRFKVRDFVLVHSLIAADRHLALDRWSLLG